MTCPVCTSSMVVPVYIGDLAVTVGGLIADKTLSDKDIEKLVKYSRFDLMKIDLAKEALIEKKGRVSTAAKWAGVALRTMYNWIDRFNLYALATDYRTVVSTKELRE